MIRYLSILKTMAVLVFSLIWNSQSAAAQDEPLPIIDWQERLTVEERLTAFGDNLMGDSIDPHIGSLTFEHTDINLPGNSGLEVSIRRRLSQGYRYDTGIDVEFGNWELVVPKISAVALASGWTGARCSGSIEQNFPDHIFHKKGTPPTEHILAGNSYNNGIWASIPGQGKKRLYKNPSAQFPSSAKAATTDEWYFTCTSASDGKQGFIGHAPNGDKYFFNKHIVRRYKELATVRQNSNIAHLRNEETLAASRVEDVHGNWVKYNYSNGKLLSISANDGREISLSYQDGMINRVSANGRHWNYDYRDSTFKLRNWDANSHPQFGSTGKIQVLSKVTRPDELFWEFNLDGMLAEASPPGVLRCPTSDETLTINHPNGTLGTFKLEDLRHRRADKILQFSPSDCPLALNEPLETGLQFGSGLLAVQNYTEVLSMRAMSTTSKTLSHDSLSPKIWTFNYEQDDVCDVAGVPCNTRAGSGGIIPEDSVAFTYMMSNTGPYISDDVYAASGVNAIDRTNWTEVTQPDGSVIKYYHMWDYEAMFGGKLIRQERKKNASILEQTGTTHTQHHRGNHFGSFATTTPVYTIKTVIQRDGDTFTTELKYNGDQSSSDYSYGRPVETKKYTNVAGSTTPRVTTTEYEHNTTKWMLGLPKRISLNDREMATYQYNSLAQRTSQSRYGQADFLTFTYHSDGTMASYEDALNRRTQADNWRRGTPQLIKQAVGTPLEIETEQSVDDNGWLTSSTDAMNRKTNYSRDIMGRLTQINPPGNWDNTNIAYSFPSSGGAVQTITKGQAKTTITYDSMFRTTLEQTQALDTGWSSFVNTAYDSMGRVTFKSQPSTNPSETKGVDTTYDGLGRVYDITETVAPYAKTRHRYLSNHRHRVYDPSGAFSENYSFGYGGPGNKDLRIIYRRAASGAILQYTKMYQNQYGQLTELVQYGGHGNESVYESQKFYYNARQRLCRHYVPEHGATKYRYDAAGQIMYYAKGQANSGCYVQNTNLSRVYQTYDKLGRPTLTNFNDPNTPDIRKTYDANGNVLSVNRGSGSSAVNWTYAYNDMNMLTHESLDVDGRDFDLAYTYNSSGHMTTKNLPGGRHITYETDGLGRSQLIRNGGITLASGTNYHANGSVHQMTYGNGQYFSQVLNDRLLPQRLLSYKAATKAIDQTLTYDVRGLVTSILDGAVSGNDRTYGYDALGYLKTASGPWGAGNYRYDSLGNLRSKQLGSRTVSVSYDSRNRASQSVDSGASGTRTIAYDTRGNVTTLGNLAMAYDMSDQPVAVSGTANGIGSANGTYQYDGNLKRVKSIINGQVIYNIYDASGSLVYVDAADDPSTAVFDPKLTDYISGPMGPFVRITNNTERYLHPDHLGSAQAGTNSAGAISWREQYTPFGEELQSVAENDNLAGFTGHIKDKATGLNYMQARYYDPVIGRFLSVDPVTFMDNGKPGQFNRYAYTFNDPINAIDPDGQESLAIYYQERDNLAYQTGNMSREDYQAVTNIRGTVAIGTASVFVPGPEDVAIGAFVATKVGQGIANVGSKIGGAIKGLFGGKKVDLGPPAPNQSTLFPGPNAGDSIPASSTGRATASEQRQLNEIMTDSGCHTCGTNNPGTSSGNAIGDHQPPTALNPAGNQQRLFPHCDSCSRTQAGQVTQEIRRRGSN